MKVIKTSDIEAQEVTSNVLSGNVTRQGIIGESSEELTVAVVDFSKGTVRGFKIRFHLYTVPGQIFYNASRRLILKGVDGLLFVADSQIERMDENLESMENLHQNLAIHSLKLTELPLVFQYNKRDLPNIVSVEELEKALNPDSAPYFECVATQGIGIFESLKAIGKKVLRSLH